MRGIHVQKTTRRRGKTKNQVIDVTSKATEPNLLKGLSLFIVLGIHFKNLTVKG